MTTKLRSVYTSEGSPMEGFSASLSIRITDHSSGVDQTIEISPVRAAVAAAIKSPTLRYVDNGDGTVTDTTTWLMWSKEDVGSKGDLESADKACSALRLAGHKDWRLPAVEELFALADRSRHSPAIDTDAFPDTQSNWYWSSTPCAWVPSCAWVVGFVNGNASLNHRDNNAFVRAVRSARPSQ